MRIGIDAHMVGENETGNESFITGVVKALWALDHDNDFYVFVQEKYQNLLSTLTRPNFQLVPLRSGNSLERNFIALPQHAKRLKLDVLFVTYTAPLFISCPVVVAVHDLSFIHFPEFFPTRLRWQLSAIVARSVKHAAHVTVLSQHTKEDLIAQYGLSDDQVSVTYLSADEQFRPIRDDRALENVRLKYHINERFILTVGNLQPRKNIPRLLEAFAQLQRQSSVPHQLVIVGQDLWYAEDIHSKVQQLGISKRVAFTGYVPNHELPALYSAAELFVYPSLFEGFGIPPLEAMRCGTATITSDTSSLPEVIGDASLMFNPYDINSITEVMAKVLTDENRRRLLEQRCLERSHTFSWDETGRRLLAVFEGVYLKSQR